MKKVALESALTEDETKELIDLGTTMEFFKNILQIKKYKHSRKIWLFLCKDCIFYSLAFV